MAEPIIEDIQVSEMPEPIIRASQDDLVDVIAVRAVKRVSAFILSFLTLLLGFLAWAGWEFRESRQAAEDAITRDLVNLKTLIEPVERQVVDLESVVGPLDKKINLAAERHTEVEELFQRQQSEFKEFQRRVDAVIASISKVETIGSQIEFIYTEQERRSTANTDKLNELASTLAATSSGLDDLDVALKQAARPQREFAVLTLSPRKESQIGQWPIWLSLGRVSRSTLETLEVKDKSGQILATWSDLSEGALRNIEFGEHSYAIEISSLSTGGLFQRNVIINGARVTIAKPIN